MACTTSVSERIGRSKGTKIEQPKEHLGHRIEYNQRQSNLNARMSLSSGYGVPTSRAKTVRIAESEEAKGHELMVMQRMEKESPNEAAAKIDDAGPEEASGKPPSVENTHAHNGDIVKYFKAYSEPIAHCRPWSPSNQPQNERGKKTSLKLDKNDEAAAADVDDARAEEGLRILIEEDASTNEDESVKDLKEYSEPIIEFHSSSTSHRRANYQGAKNSRTLDTNNNDDKKSEHLPLDPWQNLSIADQWMAAWTTVKPVI